MDIPTDTALLAKIDDFIARHGMAPTRFGVEAMRDGALLQQLRANRSLSLRNAARVLRFMKQFDAANPPPPSPGMSDDISAEAAAEATA